MPSERGGRMSAINRHREALHGHGRKLARPPTVLQAGWSHARARVLPIAFKVNVSRPFRFCGTKAAALQEVEHATRLHRKLPTL